MSKAAWLWFLEVQSPSGIQILVICYLVHYQNDLKNSLKSVDTFLRYFANYITM